MLLAVVDLGDLRPSDRVARTLGPGYINGLVAAVGERIQAAVGPRIRVVTAEPDCFAFVLPDDDEATWQGLLEQLVVRLRLPFDCAGLPGAIEPCIGLVAFRAGDAAADFLFRAGMAAALDARDGDLAWRLHDKDADLAHRRLRLLLTGLLPALQAPDQLSLVYQPRIDMASGACVSAEALLRWNHPELGSVSPGEFIPISEQTGMARFVTTWVADRALADLAAWTAAGFDHGVSINISAVNLAEENFANRLGSAIQRYQIDPARLELEFTEGALVRNSPRVRTTVAELAALGVGIAIDDFGVGYSNLQYLRDIPASSLKIDQSFVRSMTLNQRDSVIVRSMIELAHALQYRVVAEGVEDGNAQSMLASWGCDEGQGYHICRPIPLPALQSWLTGRR